MARHGTAFVWRTIQSPEFENLKFMYLISNKPHSFYIHKLTFLLWIYSCLRPTLLHLSTPSLHFPPLVLKPPKLPFALLQLLPLLVRSVQSPSSLSLSPTSFHLTPSSLASRLLLLDTGSHQIFMLLVQGPIAQTHTLLSAVLLRCVCVYYLYILWFSVSAGIANMFLNISSEIVWNSPVADNDILTALSGPRHFKRQHTHTTKYMYVLVKAGVHRDTFIKAQSHTKTTAGDGMRASVTQKAAQTPGNVCADTQQHDR